MSDLPSGQSESGTMVYLLIPEAVYDHGVIGVFSTREAAEEQAALFWQDSDGHHGLRVEEWPIDMCHFARGPQRFYILGREKQTDKPLKITFVPWETADA